MNFQTIKELLNKYAKEISVWKAQAEDYKYDFAQEVFGVCKNIPVYNDGGSLTLIAARPGTGKTTFILQAAVSFALHENKPAYIVSPEQTAGFLIRRLTQIVGKTFEKELENLPIYICDDSPIFIEDIEQLIKSKIKEGVVFIDYMALAGTNGKRCRNEISKITKKLIAITQSCKIPIVCCCQLSRKVEKGGGRSYRPILSDLTDEVTVLQDSDIILFLYRDSYYMHSEINGKPFVCNDKKAAECIVAKNNFGDTRTVNLEWNGRFFRLLKITE